jgi:hypothetical protein
MNKFKIGDYVTGNCQEVCEEGWLCYGEATQVRGINGDLILVDSCFNKDGVWLEHWMFDICSAVKWCLWLKLKKTEDHDNVVGKNIYADHFWGDGGYAVSSTPMTEIDGCYIRNGSLMLFDTKENAVSFFEDNISFDTNVITYKCIPHC